MRDKNQKIPVITIDGLTATGKGTVATGVAKMLGFHCLDSGALYRCVALMSMAQMIDDNDEMALVRCVEQMQVIFKEEQVFLGGENVTTLLRQEKTGAMASKIAIHERVRMALLSFQREFAKTPGLVADGRDMGTVVFPDADLKIFLMASEHVRAQRRLRQLEQLGFSVRIEDLVSELVSRDDRDQQRALSPTIPAHDAVIVDSSTQSVEHVVGHIVRLWINKL
jgi:cytidylate kinase